MSALKVQYNNYVLMYTHAVSVCMLKTYVESMHIYLRLYIHTTVTTCMGAVNVYIIVDRVIVYNVVVC